MREDILDQLRQELPPAEFELLRSCFGNRPWKERESFTHSKLTALAIRRKGYARFKNVAKGFGISSLICACKNPDMKGHLCTAGTSRAETGKASVQEEKQLSLFQC